MKRLLPLGGCVVLLFAFPYLAGSSPHLLTSTFQISDCRGDTSYRFGVETDTGSPRVAMGVGDLTDGLNTGGTYPSMTATWPKIHVTGPSTLIAVFRGSETPETRATGGYSSHNTAYTASTGAGGGWTKRNIDGTKTSGRTYPEILPGITMYDGSYTLNGTCPYTNTYYGPTPDPPGTLQIWDRADSTVQSTNFASHCSGSGNAAVWKGSGGFNCYPTWFCYSSCGGCSGNCDYPNTGGFFGTIQAPNPNQSNWGECHTEYPDCDCDNSPAVTVVHSMCNDEQYYENHASCSFPKQASGLQGNAYVFDASNTQYLQKDAATPTLTEFTFEAWVNADAASLTGQRAVMGTGASNKDAYIGLKDGYWAFWLGNGTTIKYLTSEAAAVAGTWVHVAGTYEPPGVNHTAGLASLYVNGRRQQQTSQYVVNTTTPTIDWTWSATTAYKIRLGAAVGSSNGSDGGGTDYFSGKLDEGAIWSRELASEEIAGIYDPTAIKYTTAGVYGLDLGSSLVFGPSATVFYTDENRNVLSNPQDTTDTIYMRTSNLPLAAGGNNYVQFIAQNTAGETAATQPFQVSVVTKLPDPPSVVTGRGVDNATVLWAWTEDYVCNPHSYDVTRTVSPGTSNIHPGGNVDASLQPYSTGYVQSGLSANQPAGLQILAKTYYGSSALTATVTAYSLANTPSGMTPVKISLTSMTFSWSNNGNPAYTPYELSLALNDPTFGPLKVSTPIASDAAYALSSATVTGLTNTTTYYFRVRAANGNGGYPGGGQLTAFNTSIDGTVPVPTLPVPPDPVTAYASSTNSVVYSWPVVPTVQRYEILSEGGSVECNDPGNTFDYAVQYGGCSGNFQNQPKGANEQVRLRVRTVNLSGASLPSPVISAFTLARAPTVLTIAGQSSNTVTLAWDANGNPASTAYQLAAALDPAFPGAGTSTITVTALTASFPGLFPGTSYYFHVRAINGDGVATALATLGGSAKTPTPDDQSLGILTSSASSVSGSDGRTRVEIPAGALAASATVYVSVNPVLQPVITEIDRLKRTLSLEPQAGIRYAPATAREVVALVNNRVSSSPFSVPVTVYLPFSDAIHPGLVDDSDPPIQTGSLKAYTLNPFLDQWDPLPSSIDFGSGRVRASTTHFSVFALFGSPLTPLADLSQVKVFPQPWRPGSGGQFDSATKGSAGPGLLFDGIPSDGIVTVYTLLGEKVVVLHAEATGSGYAAVWKGTNAAGHKVASAVYLAIIEGAGKKKTVKVGLER